MDCFAGGNCGGSILLAGKGTWVGKHCCLHFWHKVMTHQKLLSSLLVFIIRSTRFPQTWGLSSSLHKSKTTSTTSTMFTSCLNFPEVKSALTHHHSLLLVRENRPTQALWRKVSCDGRDRYKSRTKSTLIAQHVAETCKIEICCVTSWEQRW